MKDIDKIKVAKLAKEIEDLAKELQVLISKQDEMDPRMFEHDYRKRILDIHINIDYLEVISDYYYKVHTE